MTKFVAALLLMTFLLASHKTFASSLVGFPANKGVETFYFTDSIGKLIPNDGSFFVVFKNRAARYEFPQALAKSDTVRKWLNRARGEHRVLKVGVDPYTAKIISLEY